VCAKVKKSEEEVFSFFGLERRKDVSPLSHFLRKQKDKKTKNIIIKCQTQFRCCISVAVVYIYSKQLLLLIPIVIGRIPIRRGHLRLVSAAGCIFVVVSPNRRPRKIIRRSRNASNKVSNHPRPLFGVL
jgi:hypothetical protein